MSIFTTQPGNGGRCFHPGDDRAPTAGVSPCYHPGDEDAPSASVSPCFHPGDEDGAPAARHLDPVSPCFHPGDDLATDLHLALTRNDERELAVLSGRR